MDPVLRIRPFPQNRSPRVMACWADVPPAIAPMPDFAHPQQGGTGQDGSDSCSQRGSWRLTPWPMCAKNVDQSSRLESSVCL